MLEAGFLFAAGVAAFLALAGLLAAVLATELGKAMYVIAWCGVAFLVLFTGGGALACVGLAAGLVPVVVITSRWDADDRSSRALAEGIRIHEARVLEAAIARAQAFDIGDEDEGAADA